MVLGFALVALQVQAGAVQAQSSVPQKRLAIYSGVAFTQQTSLTIQQSGHSTVTLNEVRFETKPFTPPPYYSIQYGRYWPKNLGGFEQAGLEVEFIHHKLYFQGADDPDGIVGRFDVTDGLNFFFVNGVLSRRLHADWTLDVRAGVGPVISHPETEIRGLKKGVDGDWSGYYYSGLGAQVGLGARRSGTGLQWEYKFTFAEPRLPIEGGHATTPVRAHHVMVGWALVW